MMPRSMYTTQYILICTYLLISGCDDGADQVQPEIPPSSSAGESMSQQAGVTVDTMSGMMAGAMITAGEAVTTPPADGACSGVDCPMGRLVYFSLPTNADEASGRGCNLRGSKNGSAFGVLQDLANIENSSELLNPNADGFIELVLFLQMNGWAPSSTIASAQGLDLHLLVGDQEEDGSLSISSASYDMAGAPLLHFAGSQVSNSMLITPSTYFELTVPLFGNSPIRITLNEASLGGVVNVDATGMSLSNGYAQGYLTDAALLEFVEDIQTSCGLADPPSVCSLLESVLENDPTEVLSLLTSLLGGYDTVYSGESAAACPQVGDPSCNAISLCTFIELEGAEL